MMVSFLPLGISCPAQDSSVIDEGLLQVLENAGMEKTCVNIVLSSQVEPGRMKALAATARDWRSTKKMVVRAC